MKKAMFLFFLVTCAALAHAQWVSYPGFSSGWAPTANSTEVQVAAEFDETQPGGASKAGYEVAYVNPHYELQIDFNGDGNENPYCVPGPCYSGTKITVPASAFPATATYYVGVQTTAFANGTHLPYIGVTVDGVNAQLQSYPTATANCEACDPVGSSYIYGLNDATPGEFGYFFTQTLTANTTHTLSIEFPNPCGIVDEPGCTGMDYDPATSFAVGQVILWQYPNGTYTSWCNVSSGGHITSTKQTTGGTNAAIGACSSLAGSNNHWVTLYGPIPSGDSNIECWGDSTACYQVEIFD